MRGYAGKLLFVDLTNHELQVMDLPEEWAENYLSGYGIGAKVLFDRMEPKADPLGPGNILGFISGVTNATTTLMGGRYSVVCKSPVTHGFNDANSGGHFGPELKKAGFDGVFFSGISSTPVYLWIKDGNAEIRDANKLWGLDCKEMEDALIAETGEMNLKYAAIGPGGENLSYFAAIINDGHRAAARGGVGTVMGSKKLKAIAVKGSGTIEVADKPKLTELNKRLGKFLKDSKGTPIGNYLQSLMDYGTGSENQSSALSGDSPVKNWSGAGIVDFGEENAQKVAVTTYDPKYKVKKYACNSCILGCGAVYKVTDGKWPIGDTERPEYEAMAAFGSNCLNSNVEAIIYCNELCNRAGLDNISAGSVIAWAMECYENNVLSEAEFDGIQPFWGDADAMVALMEKMAKNEGCGKILALGQQGAADYFGKGYEFLTVCSGIEPPMHDGRNAGSLGFARMYQYDPTPGRHVKGGSRRRPLDDLKFKDMDWSEKDKQWSEIVSLGEMTNIPRVAQQEMTNASGICMFSAGLYPANWMNEALSAITGLDYDSKRSYYTGLRIFMLRHAFNLREGIQRQHYTMSKRLLGNPPIKEGPNKDVIVDSDLLGNLFYEGLGCDIETGIPRKETLERYGALEDVISFLYAEGR